MVDMAKKYKYIDCKVKAMSDKDLSKEIAACCIESTGRVWRAKVEVLDKEQVHPHNMSAEGQKKQIKRAK